MGKRNDTIGNASDLVGILPQVGRTRVMQASELGVTLRTLHNYISGRYPVPAHVLNIASQLAAGQSGRVDTFRNILPQLGATRAEQAQALSISNVALHHYLNGTRCLPEPIYHWAVMLSHPTGIETEAH